MTGRDPRLEETAFPSDSHRSVGPAGKWPYSPGMTLRDYFAGQALIGLCAFPEKASFSEIAGEAFELADAMIEQRKK